MLTGLPAEVCVVWVSTGVGAGGVILGGRMVAVLVRLRVVYVLKGTGVETELGVVANVAAVIPEVTCGVSETEGENV